MNLSKRIERSICGTRLLHRPSPGPPPRPACCAKFATTGEQAQASPYAGPYRHHAGPLYLLGSCFSRFGALQLQHSSALYTTCPAGFSDGFFTPHTGQRGGRPTASLGNAAYTGAKGTGYHTGEGESNPIGVPDHDRQPTKEELLAIVGQYDPNETVDGHLQFVRDPYLRGYAQPNGPVMADPPVPDGAPRHAVTEYRFYPNIEERRILMRLREAVDWRLGNPVPEDEASSAAVYAEYTRLGEPQLALQIRSLRHDLLRSLSQGVKRNHKNMLRYLSVVGTVKNCGYALSQGQWNAAMSFASRYVGSSSETEVEAALGIWREMEHMASIKANGVTFNILFDVSTKAGNFTLAEMLYREMENRRIPFNRYHNVSLIYFFGMMLNADGVRAAYREMVEAGEVIDKVVLNCVISGLLRCGDEAGAERVYEKMRTWRSNKRWRQPQAYTTHKAVTKAFIMFARVARQHPELRGGFQVAAPMMPDLQTYRILMRHYGVRVGRISDVARYLEDMKHFHVPLHGSIFLALFKAFALHGSASVADWGPERLFGVWEALLSALDSQSEGLYVDTWLVGWALRAFAKLGQRRMLLDVYAELGARWDLDDENKEFMVQFLHRLLRKHKIPIPLEGSPSWSQWSSGR
ncbi:hypothetical protein GGTG_04503 [Gaeumannomyces tritici R3-111a-1]|uniref:Pentatricopeptide repeat protein n=1 Tax=Gaeumannomyces tritici (strain R3-111a-1) TaxID=644352 RepID=J3NTA4_GAET3|nr:hypothetical protein GGTG_04503 [Gaeumannomyces tritici R3-111a-1]EJT79419.1 hypothetical protein GGTG_04503 [Gaeumannomyces tritici R3-111a-1]